MPFNRFELYSPHRIGIGDRIGILARASFCQLHNSFVMFLNYMTAITAVQAEIVHIPPSDSKLVFISSPTMAC